ncbi:MAG: hypothetical protein GZ094_05375 [Mariniphaga sp.]|nr:hypothetical protein [Mariniphaga sp.]
MNILTNDAQIMIRVTNEMKSLITKYAKINQITISRLIRDAINNEIERLKVKENDCDDV